MSTQDDIDNLVVGARNCLEELDFLQASALYNQALSELPETEMPGEEMAVYSVAIESEASVVSTILGALNRASLITSSPRNGRVN